MSRTAAASAALSRAADVLTLARLAIAPVLAAALAAEQLGTAAALLAVAWLTDAFDGQAARASALPTRLGGADLVVDTTVGAGALLGLALADEVPAWLAVTLLAVLG
jgi:phosphatidylglycerophosphate synthase